MHRTPTMPERIFVVLGLLIVLASAVPLLNPAGSVTGNRGEEITSGNKSRETNLSVSATTNITNVVDGSIQSKFDPNSMKTVRPDEKLTEKDDSLSVVKPPVVQSRRLDGLANVKSRVKSSSYPASEKGVNKKMQSRTVGLDNPTDEASDVDVNSSKHAQLEDNGDNDEEEQGKTVRHSARSSLESAGKPHVEGRDRYPAKVTPPVVLIKETSHQESVKSDRLARNVSADLVSVLGKQGEAKEDVKGLKVQDEPVKQANFQDQIAAPNILSENNRGTGKGFKKIKNVEKPDDDEEKDESGEDSKESQDIGGAQIKPPNRPKFSNSRLPSVNRFRFADTRAEETPGLRGGRRLLPPYSPKSMKPKVAPAPKLSDIHSDKTSQDELSFPVEYILMVICLIVIVVMLLWRRLWFAVCTVCTRRHSASETGGHRYKASYKPLSASA
ncbi:unnamed protein product [Calicophoron daubneyi]|uniref:Uncharacterized protein n=1 Tax=Calicophoron daubneyi TaxID=300641 RepID=A0AAV2T2B6_CALDB